MSAIQLLLESMSCEGPALSQAGVIRDKEENIVPQTKSITTFVETGSFLVAEW
jgi:hypothetical protein